MPTKNRRVHVVLEQPLFERLKRLSRKDGLSMSLKARKIIRQAFYSTEKHTMRPYTVKNIKKLIGKFKMGKIDPGELLVSQVHG